jgi:putative transposase
VDEIFLYCLAEAAGRFDVTLHGWIAMSNHEHLVVTDNLGNLPEFMGHLHKMIAKALNAHWERSENFWSTEQASAVRLIEPDDVFAKLVYVLANPVLGHLVEQAAHWPGASSLQQSVSGRSIVVERPRGFFRQDGPMPDVATLHVERPKGFLHLTQREWAGRLLEALRQEEEQARGTRLQRSLRVIGRKTVLRTPHTGTPSSPKPRGRLRPEIACRRAQIRIRELANLIEFRVRHRGALDSWRAGFQDVVFPAGTYRMKMLGAKCAAGPPQTLC